MCPTAQPQPRYSSTRAGQRPHVDWMSGASMTTTATSPPGVLCGSRRSPERCRPADGKRSDRPACLRSRTTRTPRGRHPPCPATAARQLAATDAALKRRTSFEWWSTAPTPSPNTRSSSPLKGGALGVELELARNPVSTRRDICVRCRLWRRRSRLRVQGTLKPHTNRLRRRHPTSIRPGARRWLRSAPG